MFNVTTLMVSLIIIFMPLVSFGQESDSVQAVSPGISNEGLSNDLDPLRTELTSDFSAREDSIINFYESRIDSIEKLHKTIIDSITLSLTEEQIHKQDSLRAAVTADLTGKFEKEKESLKLSIMSKMSSSKSSDSDNAKNYHLFIMELKELNEKDLFDDVVLEIENYTRLYWSGRRSEDLQLKLAQLYEEKKKKYEALASYVKFIYLYPSSPKGDDARASLINLISGKIDKKIKIKQEELTRIAALPLQEKSYPAKYFDYIQTIYNLELKYLNKWILNEVRYFNSILPNDERQPQIALWQAGLHERLGNKKESASLARKVVIGYPDSPLVPDALYLQARVQTEKLGRHTEAVSNYLSIVEKYPTHSVSATALFNAATVQTKKLKDHSEAVRTFKRIVDEYPDSDLPVEALFQGAKVLTDKVKDYNGARRFYHLVTSKYPDDPRGGEALEAAGKVAESKQKDVNKAIADYVSVHEKFPRYKKAVELLIKAAQLQEKKLKNLNAAVVTLQKIIQKYPSYKDISKIQKKIVKLNEKINKG
ncbi:MAG: tetratricopeptide repeat protein [Candidatus Marinimicrobia bacterium]|nr:tetratricopeptide repeat protein [Candidatus Neomarinimicrobiota bacterium]